MNSSILKDRLSNMNTSFHGEDSTKVRKLLPGRGRGKGGRGVHKSIRSKKIPTMVVVTIVGEDDAMYKALSKAIQNVNRKHAAHGEEPVQYIINYTSESRPSMSPLER